MTKCLVLFFCIFFVKINAQTKQIQNIVFEGAGIRGLGYAGAIKALDSAKVLPNIKRIGGTSAGAITAVLLSVGYTATEIEQIISTTKFQKFNDGGIPFFGGLHRLTKHYGWYKGNKFENWLSQLITAKTGNANITLQQLATQYKPIYVTGTCLNLQKLIIFSAETYPQMLAKDAVRISMCIPFYYHAILLDSVGNIKHKQNKKHPYNVLVDGGNTCNFPIAIFDSTKYMDTKLPNTFAVNPYSIGFRMDRKEQIKLDSDGNHTALSPIPIYNITKFSRAFFILLFQQMTRYKLTQADWERSICIDDAAIDPKIKKMSRTQINSLVHNGYEATTNYLKLHN